MTRVRLGQGGWVNSAAGLRRAGILLTAMMLGALLGAGCSSQQSTAPVSAQAPGQLGTNGMNESSLSQLQKGTLGTPNSGPLSDIHFDFNAYTIRPQDGSILRSNADWLLKHPNSQVQIEGHCDERGSEEYNIALGAKRAQAGKNYLVTLGIAANRISTISYGKELPLCTEHTEECWAQNRRDHFVVMR